MTIRLEARECVPLKKYRKFSADFFFVLAKVGSDEKKFCHASSGTYDKLFFCFAPKKNFGTPQIPEISVCRSFSGASEFREDPVFFKTSAPTGSQHPIRGHNTGCYSHYFGCQVSNPEPVLPLEEPSICLTDKFPQ